MSLPTVIQSKTETTCGLPSNPKKSDNTQAKEAKATPELMMPANDFGTWRKPIPLIKKPRRGRRGMSVIKDIFFQLSVISKQSGGESLSVFSLPLTPSENDFYYS